MGKRFQAKKLNKDDHEGVKDTAGAVKKGVGALGVITLAVPMIKKYGKDIVGIAKNIVLRK